MTKQREILNLISVIRSSHPDMVEIFTCGSCLNFFAILRAVYPEAKLRYNCDHFVTEIDGKLYDVTGQVIDLEGDYLPIEEYWNKKKRGRKLGV